MIDEPTRPEGHHATGYVAVPCTEMMPARSAEAIYGMIASAPPGTQIMLRMHHGYAGEIHQKRNDSVGEFLSDGRMDWLLFLDSDMLPPRDYIARLLEYGEDKDIIGGLYFERRPPYLPSMRCPDHGPEVFERGGLVRAHWIGTGGMMIRRRVVEALGPEPFPSRTGQGKEDGEDVAFCKAARRAGFRVWCDLDLEVGHLGMVNVERGWVQHAYWGSPAGEREMENYRKKTGQTGEAQP